MNTKYMWIEVTLCKDKLYLASCYIPHRESNYYKLYKLDSDDPCLNACADNITYVKIGKMLVVGDFNAESWTYQNVKSMIV